MEMVTSQLKLRTAACFTNDTTSARIDVWVLKKFALLSASSLSIPVVFPIELHPGQFSLAVASVSFAISSTFKSRNVCVQNIGHGPCTSQK